MKETIRQLATFNLYDYQGVEEHLEKMAGKGWRLERAGNHFWTYRRAEPARVHYAVTYSHDVSQFDPAPTEGQEVLEDLCQAAGWEKVCDWNQMQIFATGSPDPVPLETDEALRLETIHKTMRKHYYPINLVALVLSLFMTACGINTWVRTPLRFFESNARPFSTLMYGIMAALLVMNLGSYWLWRRRSLRSVAEGGGCVRQGPACRVIAVGSLVLVLLLCAVYGLLELQSGHGPFALFFVAYMVLFPGLVFAVNGTRNALKRRGVSRRKNMAATLAVDFLLAFALVGVLTFSAIRFHWFIDEDSETYIYQQMEWDTDPISIPLTSAALTGREYPHLSRWVYDRGSFLLRVRDYHERAMGEAVEDHFSLTYEIWEPKTQRLCDDLLEGLLQPQGGGPDYPLETCQPQDPQPWGAEQVYRYCLDGRLRDKWLLCWPGRVAELELRSLEGEPTPEQMALAGRVLAEA